MIPVTHEEFFLAYLEGEEIEIPAPVTRKEMYLAYLCGEEIELPIPVTIDEMYLAALCGMINEVPYPVTRMQIIWAQLLKDDESDMIPVTREERYWTNIHLQEWETVTGNPVSFTAIAAPLKQLSVAFSPVQDLHGYSNPWPAGGGKNKLQVTATTQTINGVTFTVNDDGSVNVNGTATANAVFILNSYDFDGTAAILNGCPDGGSVSTFKLDAFGASGLSEDIGSGVTISTSGTRNIRIVVFSGTTITNKLFKPMIRLATETDATFAPYSNICPISGWDGVTVWRTGKNLLTAEYFQAGLASITIGDDIDAIISSTRYIYSCVIPARSGVVFSIKSHDLTKINYYTVNRYVGRTLVDRTAVNLNDTETHTNVYFADTYDYVRVNIGAPSGVVADFANADVQLELGTTASEWQPYNPLSRSLSRSISISFGQTVYSGTLDVLTGVVTVTMASVDLGTLTWKYFPAIPYFEATLPTPAKPSTNSGYDLKNEICSILPTKTWRQLYGGTNYGISSGITGLVVDAADADYTDIEQFTSAMSGVQLVYELATPITIQLTPQQLSSLAGDNVLFSDANGDLTVEYRSN